jgi:hypothetical protein
LVPRFHEPLPVHILRQINSVCNTPSDFLFLFYQIIHVLFFSVVTFSLPISTMHHMNSPYPRFVLHSLFNSPLFDSSKYTWRKIKVKNSSLSKFLRPPVTLSPRSKYSPQHSVFKHPKSMSLPQNQTPNFSHRTTYNIAIAPSNSYVFGELAGRQIVLY